ncbi:DUF1549 and DUF1553 domain-containing protein [Limnoglobus roseus]|uniref:DUF1553 domain-containing protein n=1 Tax=Limnoglobus roseus TaxID=2598579 RepID=A0A5C1A7Z5_9BACT|nr:DUF1549 and DUF1553 domain-containing protein [Limnoglobus roseus]QEL14870.1 hypothetical protein PX52LOC_01769 [Limnoglobus roseus]
MSRFLVLSLVLLAPAVGFAADPAKAALAKKLSAAIDRHLEADWTARGIKPAAVADDAEFLRRASLDVIGRIPRVAEVTEFLADPAADKRAKLVDRLLTMPAYSRHFAYTTRQAWLPQTSTDVRFFFNGTQFEGWLQAQFRKNAAADEMVRQVLTAPVSPEQARGGFGRDRNNPELSPLVAFYQAFEGRPENLSAAATRQFLGIKLECAQCHDHPFATYTKEQFWQTAAFFGEYAALPPVPPSFVGPLPPQYGKNQMTIPNTETTLVATFLNGSRPDWQPDRNPREELAAWLTGKDNPFFAKNLTNRMWARFFGIGLIDPIDEPGDANPPSHPELLDELAAGFVVSGFDHHTLIRAITGSRAYQLTSKLSHPTQGDPRRFAKMGMKGLNGGQIFDSFVIATGLKNAGSLIDEGENDFRDRTLRGKFLKMYPTGTKSIDTQTSILQALLMMNGKQMEQQTNVDTSETLAAVVDSPFLATEERIDTLFLAVMNRKATDEEREKYGSYVDRGGPSGDKKKAIGDVMWVLLNSTEFLFNH